MKPQEIARKYLMDMFDADYFEFVDLEGWMHDEELLEEGSDPDTAIWDALVQEVTKMKDLYILEGAEDV